MLRAPRPGFGEPGRDLTPAPAIAASTGSACHSGRVELSPVLTAMGIRPEVGMGTIRFSLGRNTTIEEIDTVVDRLPAALAAGSR
jgi:cysteine desulfurase